jgi:penicillin-binding protein 2
MRRFTPFHSNKDIDPDEIFLDDKNIPEFDVHQFEGRIERPIRERTIIFVALFFIVIGLILAARAGILEVRDGSIYAKKSEQNRLEHQILFPERGVVSDRRGEPLAWNEPNPEDLGFSLRRYTEDPGFGSILGFLHYPARDKSGVYYRNDYEADSGVESYYNEALKGKSGLRIIETDALGNVVSSNVIDPPITGANLKLSVDARVQSVFYKTIGEIAEQEDYLGGAGAIMDITNGELLALVSYPTYDPNVMTDGEDREKIAEYNQDKGSPFLNRTIGGLFTPGSIVKPMFAIGALNEGIITPEKQILSIGYLTVPNPYFPDKPSRFNDWKNHGWLDMRSAIAWSSDVYIYEIAGGFEGQKGLGIKNVEKYARMFGYGSTTGIDLYGELAGTIPNPEWKTRSFPDDPAWRVGDTYFTGIGQYGMQTTVLQAVKEASIIASKGVVVRPHLSLDIATTTEELPLPKSYFNVIQEGMREAVVEGTANILNIPEVKMAAKTGTAELGVTKARVNSWVIGFFPYEKPRYAFAVVMDRGVKGNTTNASYTARQLFRHLASSTPEYLRTEKSATPN